MLLYVDPPTDAEREVGKLNDAQLIVWPFRVMAFPFLSYVKV